jgi:tripartite-type tricarboxylate transporter receptor subunit TctC
MSRGAHEQGLADFEAPTWFAVFLPRGASEPIIRKLNQAAFATADTPSLRRRIDPATCHHDRPRRTMTTRAVGALSNQSDQPSATICS